MEWIEWLLSREFRQFTLEHNLFFPLLFLVRAVGVTSLELIRPARAVAYRKVIWKDFTVALVYFFVIFPLAIRIDRWIEIRPNLPAGLLEMPLPLRVLCYFLVADFGHYWIHRLMHTKYVWRIHQWHHAPTYMYWLAGVRATIPQQVIVNLPYIFAWSFLGLSPWWMELAIGAFNAFQNDWMHMNVTWRSSRLEWCIVTPRYHHIHHSDNPFHSGKNLGALFTLWDRLFGTYADPEQVRMPISFGIREQVPLPRLALGV
ncbi:MAG TPA: sterol desaturase family protein [Nitrospira sp.]|nr:sterol desaturase family protein [Nitrospira sp.]